MGNSFLGLRGEFTDAISGTPALDKAKNYVAFSCKLTILLVFLTAVAALVFNGDIFRTVLSTSPLFMFLVLRWLKIFRIYRTIRSANKRGFQ